MVVRRSGITLFLLMAFALKTEAVDQRRLPDFSHAGYREGIKTIPQIAKRANVREFGALGDGHHDDSQAFLRAIAAGQGGAIEIPAGRYRLTTVLRIAHSKTVLRGAGRDRTILKFPRPLSEVVGDGQQFAPGKSWSWSGGFITFDGWDEGIFLSSVTTPALRGDQSLMVKSPEHLSRGQKVRLLQWNTAGALGRDLHGGYFDASRELNGRKLVDFAFTIRRVKGSHIEMDRPLRMAVDPSFKPALYAQSPSVEDVGLEDVTLEFPDAPYIGHHAEPGFNAVELSGVSNAWVRRVRVINADSAIFVQRQTRFCTIEDIQIEAGPHRPRIGYGGKSDRPRTLPVAGHHAILVSDLAQDNLIRDVRISVPYIHDLGLSAMAAGNVFTLSSSPDMSLDHHRRTPYENLLLNLAAGAGTRLWESGGDESDGPPSGAWETFWGIQTRRAQRLPEWAIDSNFVGVQMEGLSEASAPRGNWIEPLPPPSGYPKRLSPRH